MKDTIVTARMYRSASDRRWAGHSAILIWPLDLWSWDGLVRSWFADGSYHGIHPVRAQHSTQCAPPADAEAAIALWRAGDPARAALPLTLRRRWPTVLQMRAARIACRTAWLEDAADRVLLETVPG